MIRTFALFALIFVTVVESAVIEKITEDTTINGSTDFVVAIDKATDLAQEGQSSDIIVRAKRYYGCGCGCGCATVAAVSVAPCGYGCCGCGYGK